MASRKFLFGLLCLALMAGSFVAGISIGYNQGRIDMWVEMAPEVDSLQEKIEFETSL
jgi:hypothetical protein